MIHKEKHISKCVYGFAITNINLLHRGSVYVPESILNLLFFLGFLFQLFVGARA